MNTCVCFSYKPVTSCRINMRRYTVRSVLSCGSLRSCRSCFALRSCCSGFASISFRSLRSCFTSRSSRSTFSLKSLLTLYALGSLRSSFTLNTLSTLRTCGTNFALRTLRTFRTSRTTFSLIAFITFDTLNTAFTLRTLKSSRSLRHAKQQSHMLCVSYVGYNSLSSGVSCNSSLYFHGNCCTLTCSGYGYSSVLVLGEDYTLTLNKLVFFVSIQPVNLLYEGHTLRELLRNYERQVSTE